MVTFFPFCCLFSFVKRLYRLYRLRSQKKLDIIELFLVTFFPFLVTFFPFWLHNMKAVAFSYINRYNCIEKVVIFL